MAIFSPWDYVMISLLLIFSASVGLYFRFTGGKQKTTKEFLLGNKSMSIWPVAVSLMTSFMSAITLMGVSSETYQFGTIYVVTNITYIVATPLAAYIYLPVFLKLETTSVYEYLGLRFGGIARLAASTIYSLQMIFYMGIVLYAPALALEAVTGLNKSYAILLLGLVCTFYSTLGGMKAVVFTDVFQSFLMFVALFSVIIVAASHAGGLGPIWKAAEDGGRIQFFNFDPDPTIRHSWWSIILGGTITYVSIYGVNQVQVQRMQSVRNLKEAQKTIWINVPFICLLNLTTSFSGLAIYYMFKDCDPVLDGRITSRDQILPLFVVETMGHIPGLSGLVVSGLFSASLSTVSPALNALAAVTLQDYIKPIYQFVKKKPMLESGTLLSSKITACFYGLFCTALAFLAHLLGGIMQAALTVFGIVGGPLLGLFSLGMFATRPNEKGALTGFLVGLGIAFWLGFGGPKPPLKPLDFSVEGCATNNTNEPTLSAIISPRSDDSEYFWLYRISYLYYSLAGFIFTFVIGYVFSYIYEKLNIDSNSKIYVDQSNSIINYNLFCPPLAKKLARNNENIVKNKYVGRNAEITRF